MPDVIIVTPPPIIAQVKGGKTTAISAPAGSATRLVELSDVDTANLVNGEVLTYVQANGRFEFEPQASASATDTFARLQANNAFDKANGAFDKANTANVTGQAAFDKANTAIYTAAQIRANISNTAPINYDSATGIISHADSGAVATTYGNTTFVATVTVDAKGHVTSVTNTAINFPPGGVTSVAGKTGVVLLDTNDIAENAASNIWFTAARVRANVSNTTPINYVPATGVFSHADSGVAPSGYGDAATVAKVVVDVGGHITSVVNTAIAISAAQITSGTLAVARGGTGQTAITVNGSLLIGNTVSGGFDVNPITATSPVVVTNDKGSIALTHATSGVVATGHGDAATVPKFTVDDKGHVTAVTNTAIAITTTAVSEAAGGPFFHTAARVRGNVTNTAPINYDATTGTFSHALSGATASGYGDAATVPKVVVDDKGHVTSVVNTAIAISAAAITSGTLAVARGGTGQTAITVNGSLLIGNTVSGGFDVNPLTQGTGIVITNDKGSITIAATGGSAIDQYARDKANGAAQNAFVTLNVAGQSDIVADSNTDTLIIVGSGITITTDAGADTLTLTHPDSGVVATGHGDAATVPKFIVDARGHVTSVTNTAIAISAAAITSGTLAVARGGTGQTAITVNGSLLIGNTVSGGYDVNPLTQGTGISITNDKGSITIAATGGVGGNNFGVVNVAGQSDIVSEVSNDTLVIVGSGITVTTDASTDTLTLTHPDSGVVATGHGDAATVPKFVVDARGHVTSVTNTAIAISAAAITSGTLAVARGGTGQTAITVNGSLLIGNTISGGFDVNPITSTSPIVVANDKGSIAFSHATSGVVATGHGDAATVPKFTVDDKGHVTAVTNTAIAITTSQVSESAGGPFFHTAARVRGNVSNTAPINYDATTGIFSHADSGVVATGHGDAATVPKFTVDDKGHVTAVTNTAIAISAAAITSGTLVAARGGTGQTAITLNGAILIANTVSAGYDLNRLTAGTGININNDKGSIEIVATGGSATDQFARDTANGAFAKANTIRKSITVTSPVVTDNITFFFTDIALTFTKVVSVVRGTATPNVVFNLTYESSRHTGASRTDITGNITCANTTNGVFTTTFANATVPANNYVTLTHSTVSGTVDELAITMLG